MNESRSNDGTLPLPLVDEEPASRPALPPLGIVPENDVSVRTRPPLAAVTPFSAATFVTELAAEASSFQATRGGRCARWWSVVDLPLSAGPEKRCGPSVPGVAVFVTVMSVPIP